jgi:hypothetical protein
MRFLGSSIRLAGASWCPTPDIPPKTEPSILGVPVPFGETDLEPVGVEVEAKREDTDAFEARYGKLDVEEAIERGSPPLILGSLKDGVLEGLGRSMGGAFGDVMNVDGGAPGRRPLSQVEPLQPWLCPAPCGWIESNRYSIVREAEIVQDLASEIRRARFSSILFGMVMVDMCLDSQ